MCAHRWASSQLPARSWRASEEVRFRLDVAGDLLVTHDRALLGSLVDADVAAAFRWRPVQRGGVGGEAAEEVLELPGHPAELEALGDPHVARFCAGGLEAAGGAFGAAGVGVVHDGVDEPLV